jgi:hypothetical protein
MIDRSNLRRLARIAAPVLWLLPAAAGVVLAAGCGGLAVDSKPSKFRPGVAAIPHALFDPSAADELASDASYAAWVELNVAWGPQHTLDLAVWSNQAAAKRALAQYRGGGAKTRPLLEGNGGWPRKVRRVERIQNVTLAWYHLPTAADERAVKGALRFGGGGKSVHNYTTLWVMPGTVIHPDATAATGPARYSARLEAAGRCPCAVRGPLTLAIWPSEKAAKRYVQEAAGYPGPHPRRIRNATVEAADFSDVQVSDADEAAVKNALH